MFTLSSDNKLVQMGMNMWDPSLHAMFGMVFYGGARTGVNDDPAGSEHALQPELFHETRPAITMFPSNVQGRIIQAFLPTNPTKPTGGKVWLDILRNFPLNVSQFPDTWIDTPRYDAVVRISAGLQLRRATPVTGPTANRKTIDVMLTASPGYAMRASAGDSMTLLNSDNIADDANSIIGPASPVYGTHKTNRGVGAITHPGNGVGAELWVPWMRYHDRLIVTAAVNPLGTSYINTDNDMLVWSLDFSFIALDPTGVNKQTFQTELINSLAWPVIGSSPVLMYTAAGIPITEWPITDDNTLDAIRLDAESVMHVD